ncbi:MAG TPA: tetratricopeptide repeat protein, partial [Lacipirellulaceae bacterium]|nr:tetratricopeptide repeat protein [Lacipirellulaceae bacterium]
DVFAAATKQGTPTADCLYNLAQAYVAAGDIEQATATAQRALALDGGHQPSRELLAQLAAKTTPNGIQRR